VLLHASSGFGLYTWELNFGQTIWDKTQVLLGTSWRMHLGTIWEQMGNKGKKQIILFFPPPLKKKKLDCSWCMLSLPIGYMKFPFPKLFLTIFSLG
jgi:predicted AlkP superfamily phosphohydrolase/phosphomutase